MNINRNANRCDEYEMQQMKIKWNTNIARFNLSISFSCSFSLSFSLPPAPLIPFLIVPIHAVSESDVSTSILLKNEFSIKIQLNQNAAASKRWRMDGGGGGVGGTDEGDLHFNCE